jgi:hypothetical protein
MATDGTHVRMTVAQAAQALGISAEAVRQRVRRGTLPTEKSEDGSVFVLIDPLQYAERTRTDGVGTGDGTSDEALLSAHLDHALEEIRFLRSELSTRNEELRRKDHIIAALTERIPGLPSPPEASPEPRESPETPTVGTEKAEPQPERVPWWRRIFQ